MSSFKFGDKVTHSFHGPCQFAGLHPSQVGKCYINLESGQTVIATLTCLTADVPLPEPAAEVEGRVEG